jgi:hypothetical protein
VLIVHRHGLSDVVYKLCTRKAMPGSLWWRRGWRLRPRPQDPVGSQALLAAMALQVCTTSLPHQPNTAAPKATAAALNSPVKS